MNKLKEWFSSLGVFGMIIAYVLSAIYFAIPLVVMNLPFWAIVIVVLAFDFIPALNYLDMVLWTISFVVSFFQPIWFLTILFYIIYAIKVFIFIKTFFSYIRNN